jgi:hypothetical protein
MVVKRKSSNISPKLLRFFYGLKKLNTSELRHVIEHLNEDGVNAICECMYNIIHTDLGFTNKTKNRLRKHLKTHCKLRNLKTILRRNNDYRKRKRALIQEGGGLGVLFKFISPILTSLLSGLISSSSSSSSNQKSSV